MAARKRKDPELFLNRELSWLAFNERVLEEAEDTTNPPLERLKFALIVGSNLDEFFMVRVAGLRHAVAEGDTAPDPAGLTPTQQLASIAERAHAMVERQYAALMGGVLPALAERGIRVVRVRELEPAPRAAVARFFREELLPALTPMAIDASRPFPMLAGLSLNLALLLSPEAGEEQPRLAVVQVPGRLPRLVRPAGLDGTSYVLLEDVIREELQALFPGQALLEAAVFRISRDSELDLDDEGGRDYIRMVEEELRKRRRSAVLRLELEGGTSDALVGRLCALLQLEAADVYRVAGPLDVRAFWALVDLPTLEDLRDKPLKPLPALVPREMEDLFGLLDEKDVLLHHPYDDRCEELHPLQQRHHGRQALSTDGPDAALPHVPRRHHRSGRSAAAGRGHRHDRAGRDPINAAVVPRDHPRR